MAANPVAQRHSDSALCRRLTDDVLVEFTNDFPWSQFIEMDRFGDRFWQHSGQFDSSTATVLQLLNRHGVVGIDADLPGDVHGFLSDFARAEVRVLQQRSRGGQRIGATGTDGNQAVIGLD